MAWGDADERIELVARRADVIAALTGAPEHKPALVEALGHSRSTVDRAIRRLEAAGLVERTDEGFRATLAGRHALDRYRAFVEAETAVLDAVDVLGSLPPDADLPAAVVAESRAESFASPARAFEALVEPLRTADRYVAVLPELTDSRHLRLCHARVRTDGMGADLLVTPTVLDRLETEFPRLAADLATAESVTVWRVDEPRPYALCLAHGADPALSIRPTEGRATSLLTATGGRPTEWAEETVAALRETATDVTAEVAGLADRLDDTLLGRHERRGPAGLADVGVERVDAGYFSRRTPNDPATGWRVGFDLVDVYYGHPFERRHRPDREVDRDHPRAVDHVTDALAGGDDRVVVGLPGTGKSTLCRQVACRWVAEGRGPVFYRQSPTDTPFDRPEVLTAALDDAAGHSLVVVEDGGDEATAEALAPVLARARDDPSVSLLVESRTSDWPPSPEDPRGADLFGTALTEYRLGELDLEECRDAVAAFEAATGREVPPSAEDLFDMLREGDGPGDCSLLGYLLAAHTTPVPWSDAVAEPTGLDADARAGYAVVAPDDPDDDTLSLQVGLLAAVLAAARQPVTPGVLHTVAVAHADRTDGDRASAHRRVDAAIERLRGVLLFDSDDTAFRTQHPYWAVRFLEAALADRERTTVNAFERAVSGLFAAADDPAARDHVESWLGRRVEGFDRDEQGSDLVGAVFEVVRTYTSLVPLFGTTTLSGIELPGTCSAETRLDVRTKRLFGWYKYGDLERAHREATALLEAAETADVDDATAARFAVQARRRLADIADDRSDADTAREHLRAGLDVARAVDDRRGETRLLTSLGMVELHADAYDAAEEYLHEAEEVGEPLGACPERSATKYYLGRLHRKRGDLATAQEYLTGALALDRECDSLPPSDAAATLNALGTVAADRGAFDCAQAYYRQALERQREANNRRGVATTLVNIGNTATETGDVETAASCFEEALDVATAAEAAVVQGAAFGGLGRVALTRGDHEAAAEYHRERSRVDDSPRTSALVARDLGDVAADRGEFETARERFEEAFETFTDIGSTDRAADTALKLVEACAEAGETAAARSWVERVRELATDPDLASYREAAAAWAERLPAQ